VDNKQVAGQESSASNALQWLRAHNINPWRRGNACPFYQGLKKDKQKGDDADAVEKLLSLIGLGDYGSINLHQRRLTLALLE
jgi:hypothetical protein